jgi:hypothetical protein
LYTYMLIGSEAGHALGHAVDHAPGSL